MVLQSNYKIKNILFKRWDTFDFKRWDTFDLRKFNDVSVHVLQNLLKI